MRSAEIRVAILPMGSACERAMFLLFEAMVTVLSARLGMDAMTMRAHHTNLEWITLPRPQPCP